MTSPFWLRVVDRTFMQKSPNGTSGIGLGAFRAVEADRLDADADLADSRLRLRDVLEFEHLGRAIGCKLHDMGHG
jgi:hypothetical protein